jgi:hypothetical protein
MSPNAGGRGSCGVSANEYSCTHGAQINLGDLTPYTYVCEGLIKIMNSKTENTYKYLNIIQ